MSGGRQSILEARQSLQIPMQSSLLGGRPTSPRASISDGANFAANFTSDLGRTKFGFSREEIDTTGYYEGQFKMYQRSGQGILYYPDTGDKYVGQFDNDHFHGEGVRIWEDTSEYTGQWVRGQKHGRGDFKSADNLKYIGQWSNGLRHGQGMQEYANGDRYEGFWFHGVCCGIGTYSFVDGSRYDGAWSNGRYDGNGILVKADGTKERHVYKNGVLCSRDVVPTGYVAGETLYNLREREVGGRRRVKVVASSQRRELMQRPTIFPKLMPSQFLIKKETNGEDLSSPPLSARLKSAESTKMSHSEKASIIHGINKKLEMSFVNAEGKVQGGSAPYRLRPIEEKEDKMPLPPPRTAPAGDGKGEGGGAIGL